MTDRRRVTRRCSRAGLTLRSVALALLVVLSVPVASGIAFAQAAKRIPRIGILTWDGCPGADSSFGRGLADLGYTWGQSIQIECRSAEGDYERLTESAAALVARRVDLIAGLTHITAYAAHRATREIPIVMIASGDPVRSGLVASLGRPGGNVTGLTYYAAELVQKRLQILVEMVPRATRLAVLGTPGPTTSSACSGKTPRGPRGLWASSSSSVTSASPAS